MLGIVPGAAGSSSKHANHCAMLPPQHLMFEQFENTLDYARILSHVESKSHLDSVDLCVDLPLVGRRPEFKPKALLELTSEPALIGTHLKEGKT